MSTSEGFTLIEILVVVLILGITLSFTLISFGDFGQSRQAIISAEQLSSYINLLRQQAILSGETFGVQIKADGYETYRLEYEKKWITMPLKSFFHHRTFPPKLIIKIENPLPHSAKPTIIINSTGDISSFSIIFGTAQKTKIANLIASKEGKLLIQ